MASPSSFLNHPYDSVFRHTESEIVARNIMVILKRTGNEWRTLSWEEYEQERQKDGEFTWCEKAEFERVLKYCTSESEVRKFSPEWSKK